MDPKREAFEAELSVMARELDEHLEDIYGRVFSLHPNRLARGMAANPAYDGLFATTVPFTLGYGSVYGRGYLVNIDISTLEKVDSIDIEAIRLTAFVFIEAALKRHFPERDLQVVRDKGLIKIIGDFA